MSRHYGDPQNTKHEGDRHDQLPRWVSRSPKFLHMAPADAKLYLYLASKQNWDTRKVPSVTPTELAEKLNINRNRIAEGIRNLVQDGLLALAPRSQRAPYELQILFTDPDCQKALDATNNTPHLSADVKKLSRSSERSNGIEHTTHDKMASDAIEDGVPLDRGWPSDWDLVPNDDTPDGYAPGLDAELLGGGAH